jgi:hypothetical protein
MTVRETATRLWVDGAALAVPAVLMATRRKAGWR